MTPHTTVPLLWDGDGFRPVANVLSDLGEWGDTPPERTQG